MNKILVTAGSDVISKDDSDLIVWEGGGKIPLQKLLSLAVNVKGIVCGDEPYTAEIMDQLPNLKILSRAGNGWDNIDKEEAAKRGIKVCRQENAYVQPVADSAVGMMLIFARQIFNLNVSMHNGKWERIRFPGISMQEATIGIIGYGHIGKAVHDRVVAHKSKVLIYSPINNTLGAVSLNELLEQSDFVTLHTQLSPITYHLIDRQQLTQMKNTAVLINTARGGIINTESLVWALENKKIAGAGLDVFEEEPLPTDHFLRKQDNVILSPHNSYWSPEERKRTVANAIADAREWIQ